MAVKLFGGDNRLHHGWRGQSQSERSGLLNLEMIT